MFLSHSTGRKVLVTAIAVVPFAVLYEVTFLDSRFAARQADQELTASPAPGRAAPLHGDRLLQGDHDGVGGQRRARASPPPTPTCCRSARSSRSTSSPDRYNGIYTVMDTGPKVQGRHLDIYIWSCDEALELGRRDMVDHSSATGLESPEQHAPADRPPVPAA